MVAVRNEILIGDNINGLVGGGEWGHFLSFQSPLSEEEGWGEGRQKKSPEKFGALVFAG